MRRRSESALGGLLRAIILPLAAVAVLMAFAGAVNSLEQDSWGESKRQLEEALRRGCVACYAAEGSYPSDLDYLKEHYGIQIDETRYTVYYNIFASNLMPDITVLEGRK